MADKKLYETINAGNWIKGRLYNGEKACLIGHGWRLGGQWYRPLENAIRLLYPERIIPGENVIVGFNNHPETTVEDVLWVCKVADV